MNSFTFKLSQAIDMNLAFCLIRKPTEKMIQLFVQDDSSTNRIVLHSFDSKKEKFISDQHPSFLDEELFDFQSNLHLNKAKEFRQKTQEQYHELIQKTVHDIQTSDLRKVVISRKKQIENLDYNLFQTFGNLLQSHPNALVFLWHNPNEETWIGATPELLLSQEKNTVKTVSLAGTKIPEVDWTDKELDEQQIVTDFIVSQFQGLEDIQVKGPETVQAGKFQHLKSYISAKNQNNDSFQELLAKMHPTPALCGMPKQEAFEYIVKNEGYDREFYSGFIGIENSETKEYFVNLRSAQIFEDKIWIYVGGGITADSNPEKEWMETELKSGTIQNALQ